MREFLKEFNGCYQNSFYIIKFIKEKKIRDSLIANLFYICWPMNLIFFLSYSYFIKTLFSFKERFIKLRTLFSF